MPTLFLSFNGRNNNNNHSWAVKLQIIAFRIPMYAYSSKEQCPLYRLPIYVHGHTKYFICSQSRLGFFFQYWTQTNNQTFKENLEQQQNKFLKFLFNISCTSTYICTVREMLSFAKVLCALFIFANFVL